MSVLADLSGRTRRATITTAAVWPAFLTAAVRLAHAHACAVRARMPIRTTHRIAPFDASVPIEVRTDVVVVFVFALSCAWRAARIAACGLSHARRIVEIRKRRDRSTV